MKDLISPQPTIDDLIAEFRAPEHPKLLIVTGESGAGKTTWCTELAHRALSSGLTVAGLLSPAVFEGGEKVAIDLLDISSAARSRLAGRRPATESGRKWRLDPEVLSWANHILASIVTCQLLIVDELGPLELLEHQGFTAGLELLDRKAFSACAVVRPTLLGAAQERWPWAGCVSI
jgi:nucleoside-triphosphatase THEP1